MRISDTAGTSGKFTFTAGTTLGAGQYLVLYADSGTGPGTHLGFNLSGSGEGVYLYNSAANGGALVDSVAFGQQVSDLSIGRVGQDGHWALNTPTFGAANVELHAGTPTNVKINEWFANGKVKLVDDFVELYNPDNVPVDISGAYLTDDPIASHVNAKYKIVPLSFIGAGGFVSYAADSKANSPDHVNFSLNSNEELIGLFDANIKLIDKVIYYPQTTDYSQGRLADGSGGTPTTYFPFFSLPTPAASNALSSNTTLTGLMAGLRITEIMYNPLGGPNTEYVELTNVGGTTLDLTGVRIASGIDFVFPSMTLAAGARTVVVGDAAAFAARYGSSINVAGVFSGDLSNGGEELDLLLPTLDVALLRFTYADTWFPTTDGPGYSLEVASPRKPPPPGTPRPAGRPAATSAARQAWLIRPPRRPDRHGLQRHQFQRLAERRRDRLCQRHRQSVRLRQRATPHGPE